MLRNGPGADHHETSKMSRRVIGCAIPAAMLLVSLLACLLWPYRAQTVVGVVAENHTPCAVKVNQISGWKRLDIGPYVHSEDLAYPLRVVVFPTCGDEPPFSARLSPITPGDGIVESVDCGNTPTPDGHCRLEASPITSRSAAHSYIVRIVRRRGEAPVDFRLDVTTPYAWRSVVIDAILSV